LNLTQSSELLGIDLQDSFVLSWSVENDWLTFEVEASIWPDSPHYEPPLPDEYTCYKRATLTFHGFDSIEGLKHMEDVRFSVDPDGSRDFGNIDVLEAQGNGYRVVGDFGDVTVSGGLMQFAVVPDN
jgi:hypothetical protein